MKLLQLGGAQKPELNYAEEDCWPVTMKVVDVEWKYGEDPAEEEPEEEGEEVPADEEEEFEVQYARLRKVVDGLPEKCREIFILGCVDGLSYKEVSEKMGVSVNTVKTQIKLAYRKLKLELGGQNFVWEWTAGGVLFILMQK